MKEAKDKFIYPLVATYKRKKEEISSGEGNTADSLEALTKLNALIKDLNKKIPVWPFNIRSFESFFGTVIVPVLPVLLPFVVNAVSGFIKSGLW